MLLSDINARSLWFSVSFVFDLMNGLDGCSHCCDFGYLLLYLNLKSSTYNL